MKNILTVWALALLFTIGLAACESSDESNEAVVETAPAEQPDTVEPAATDEAPATDTEDTQVVVEESAAEPEEDEVAFLISSFEKAVRSMDTERSVEDDLTTLELALGPNLESGFLLLGRAGEVLSLNPSGAELIGGAPPETGTPVRQWLAGHRELAGLISAALDSGLPIQRKEVEIRRGEHALTLGLSWLPKRELTEDQSTTVIIGGEEVPLFAPGKKGDEIPFVPEWTINGTAQYNFPITGLDSWEGWLRGEFFYKDESRSALQTFEDGNANRRAFRRIGT